MVAKVGSMPRIWQGIPDQGDPKGQKTGIPYNGWDERDCITSLVSIKVAKRTKLTLDPAETDWRVRIPGHMQRYWDS